MKNILHIEKNDTLENKVNALVEVVNKLTDQMYKGRVIQAQADIVTNKASAEAATLNAELGITDQDLLNIENGLLITDLDLRVMALEGNNNE